jgi:hypothetical protein
VSKALHVEALEARMENILFSRSKPPSHANQRDDEGYAYRVVHIRGRDRSDRWEEKYHADEKNPYHSDRVNGSTPAAHGIWAFDERYTVFIDTMSNYNGDVAKVKSWGSDVKNCNNRLARADPDEIQATAKGHNEPHCVDGCSCEFVDITPETV